MPPEQPEQQIRSGIPISAQMDFRVLDLSENSIAVRGGGKQNVNVHGTTFPVRCMRSAPWHKSFWN